MEDLLARGSFVPNLNHSTKNYKFNHKTIIFKCIHFIEKSKQLDLSISNFYVIAMYKENNVILKMPKKKNDYFFIYILIYNI